MIKASLRLRIMSVVHSPLMTHVKVHRDSCNSRSHSRGSLYARDSSGSRDQRTPHCQQQPPDNQGLQPKEFKISVSCHPNGLYALRWLQSTSVGLTSKNCNLRLFSSAEKLAARPTTAGSTTSLRRFSLDLRVRGILNLEIPQQWSLEQFWTSMSDGANPFPPSCSLTSQALHQKVAFSVPRNRRSGPAWWCGSNSSSGRRYTIVLSHCHLQELSPVQHNVWRNHVHKKNQRNDQQFLYM